MMSASPRQERIPAMMLIAVLIAIFVFSFIVGALFEMFGRNR